MKKKSGKRTVTAKVVGAIPHLSISSVAWKVRLVAPYFRFFLDSEMTYESRERAEAEADKWRKRKILITIEK